MISVGIIVPTWHYYADPYKLQPLLELYFATVIDHHFRGKNVKISVIDLRRIRKDYNKFKADKLDLYVSKCDIYFYWIAKSADYFEIVSIVNELRKIYPSAKHAAGGTHVDYFTENCQKHFDAVLIGPGEESFIRIINDLKKNSLRGVYKSNWEDVHYNNYPFARRHYLPKESIVNTAHFQKYGGVKGTNAQFSRGCSFRCSYCAYNVPKKIQMKSPESIEEEINYLKTEYKVEAVNLRDEICIPLSRKVAIPYLEAMGRSNIIWRGQTRVGAPKDLIKLAKQSGCVELAIGVESVSQQVIDIVNKGQRIQQVRDFFDACKSIGIKVKMCLILGLPGEPRNIVDITRSFIEEVQPDYVNVSGFCPIPGSEIFNNKDYYGIKYIDENWNKHFHLVFRFSDEEEFGIPFEYCETNKWGKTFTRQEIVNNIKELQRYLRERNMSY